MTLRLVTDESHKPGVSRGDSFAWCFCYLGYEESLSALTLSSTCIGEASLSANPLCGTAITLQCAPVCTCTRACSLMIKGNGTLLTAIHWNESEVRS